MTEKDKSTEKQILEAAKKVFLEKGFDGARMQEIADEAGINKALVHYYFRSKEKLFDAIFIEVFSGFFPKVFGAIFSDMSFEDKIAFFIDNYIDLLAENSFLPVFIIHEINRNPEKIVGMMKNIGVDPKNLQFIFADIDKSKYKIIEPRHFMVNMLGLCIFPFIAKPILKGLLFNNSDIEYKAFLDQRKKIITETVINSIRIK